ncbi:MAG TPA: NRAMP family divalent metal transporter [Thermomicrobiaceae bacterium]|nr:NRAMP family divalent metal transporter [Thermomicrobiaceae bacterium]
MAGGPHALEDEGSEDRPAEDQPSPSPLATVRAYGPLTILKALGPGLISGASDNDPTTVASIAVIGATTVYGLSWLTILLLPMLASIQVISAQVGVVAKQGLQRAVRGTYGRGWGLLLLISVLAVNVVTLAADLEAGAASLSLLFHRPWQWFVIPFGVAALGMLVLGSYDEVQRVLRYVLFVFVAYVVSAFVAHPNWGQVLHQTLLPPISFHPVYIQAALALLGTTLTSYAYVWETIEEAEERTPLRRLGLARADAGFGMFFAVAVFWFILISTGATLGVHHQKVDTAQQAAQALTPVAGPLAGYIFAIGLLASAILAVPVLAATTAYILGEEFGWRRGLSEKVGRARRFYTALGAAVLLGIVISFAGISPIRILFVSGIIGGLGTPISLVFLLLIARDQRVMRRYRVGRLLTAMGWGTAVLVAAVSVYFLYQTFVG